MLESIEHKNDRELLNISKQNNVLISMGFKLPI